jgi:hypothetical protein
MFHNGLKRKYICYSEACNVEIGSLQRKVFQLKLIESGKTGIEESVLEQFPLIWMEREPENYRGLGCEPCILVDVYQCLEECAALLKMELVCSSNMVNFHHTAQHHIPRVNSLHRYHHENLKSHIKGPSSLIVLWLHSSF